VTSYAQPIYSCSSAGDCRCLGDGRGRSCERCGYETYSPFVSRIEPVIIYDFEPGVIVRCYWCPLWQNLHYFPRTGKRPKVGRREVLPTRRMQKPQEFYRYWSVSSVFAPQLSPTAAPEQ
ncbi:MAG: hypothetical protein WB614_18485, partial [Pseudolabrys sp.]